eukprot:6488788-Prymnesium_polylepis.1
MKTVPREKGVVAGPAVVKAAAMLNVSYQSVKSLETRSKTSMKPAKLVLFLKAPFPMEYEARGGGGTVQEEGAAAAAAAADDVDAALVAAVLAADPATLSPRKRAMRRALQRKEQQVVQLTNEKELLEKLLTSERQAAALKLAQDGREIRRLRNQ